jgi:hypothetical protein
MTEGLSSETFRGDDEARHALPDRYKDTVEPAISLAGVPIAYEIQV